MENNFENYHHHHWRPGPKQPNICPICSATHFPFCPPYPPPSSFPHNPNFPPHLPRPGFESLAGPPIRPPNHYPFGDPRPWQAHHGNLWRPVSSEYHSAVDGDRDADRSYKRARIDAIGGGSPSYGVSGNDGYQSPRILWENERRLKMVKDHGYSLNMPSPGSLHFSNIEMNHHQYGRSEFRNGGQFNGVAPPPPPPQPYHPPLPTTSYEGYYGGPNCQPPLPVSPPPPLPPSHPSSLLPVTTNSSATVIPPPTSSSSFYPQMTNASVVLLPLFLPYLENILICCTDELLIVW